MIDTRDLILTSESVQMLDRFGCDIKAFLNARIDSFVKFRHRLPDTLRIVEVSGVPITLARRAELIRVFREILDGK